MNRASILVHDFLKNSELLQAAKAAVELKTRESVLKKLNEIREDQKAQKAGIYRKAKSEPDR